MIWEQAAQDDLDRSLKLAFERHDAMAKALKYDDHTSSFNYGGFFFWYCMRSRTEAITKLQNESARTAFAKQQHAIIMGLPEIDGCFVDSHEIGRSYGTAMALLCFADCEKAQRRNAP